MNWGIGDMNKEINFYILNYIFYVKDQRLFTC